MQPTDKQQNAFETSGTSPPEAPGIEPSQPPLSQEERKAHRTLGLRLFDLFLYPFLTNFVVFGLSVYTTYLTTKGHTQFKPGTAMDKVGNFFHRRGTWLEEKFMGFGMGQESASMSKMVFFSFLDGTFIAPFVKLFEDRREKIGKWVDDKLGTTPSNLSVYEAEPKQTWGSVLAGRIVTVAPVALTAGLLDKTDLNNTLFRKPGEKVGHWMEKKPFIARTFPRMDMPELMKTSFFEFFYTSVCTTGLYYISRLFARRHDAKTGRVEQDPNNHQIGVQTKAPIAANDPREAANENTPHPHVRNIQSQDRVAAAPHQHSVTA